MSRRPGGVFFFFFNDTATTEIYTLSLHDALPILVFSMLSMYCFYTWAPLESFVPGLPGFLDRKSTRLNSSHLVISYAVFCLKKKKNPQSHSSPSQTRTDIHHSDDTAFSRYLVASS